MGALEILGSDPGATKPDLGRIDASICVERRDGGVLVKVSGDLDWRVTDGIDIPLPGPHGPRVVVLDLRPVGRIDSSGSAALLRAWLTARRHGLRTAVAADRPDVVELLQRIHLADLCPLLGTDAEVSEWIDGERRREQLTGADGRGAAVAGSTR